MSKGHAHGRANGMVKAVFGGARPRAGTPPFAPEVWDPSGGANMPTTPDTLPVKRGLSGFLDRVLNPTNALGQFGQALVAGGGGPLGNAMAYMMQQRMARQEPSKFDEWRQQYDYELAHPKASTAPPYRWEANDGSLMELGPDGQPSVRYSDPTPKMNFIPDGMGGGQWIAVPKRAPGALAQGAAPQGVLGAELPPGWQIEGGASGNARGGFPRVP